MAAPLFFELFFCSSRADGINKHAERPRLRIGQFHKTLQPTDVYQFYLYTR
jgi:hypothetical protein